MLKDSKVVVVGGSSGIGLAVAEAAAAEGAEVVIAGRSQERLDRAVESIPGAQGVQCDVREESTVADLLEQVGTLDHVVMTAAEVGIGPLIDVPNEVIARNFDSRVWGSIFVARHAAPRMSPGGSITFMSGVAAWKGLPGEAVGAGSVGAIEALTRGLAVELAPTRVNCLCPGLVDTPLLHEVLGEHRDAVVDMFADKLLVKRIGRPEEVAKGALFLMSNGYVTGTTLHIDGGHLLV